jgi:hypothetical protein
MEDDEGANKSREVVVVVVVVVAVVDVASAIFAANLCCLQFAVKDSATSNSIVAATSRESWW